MLSYSVFVSLGVRLSHHPKLSLTHPACTCFPVTFSSFCLPSSYTLTLSSLLPPTACLFLSRSQSFRVSILSFLTPMLPVCHSRNACLSFLPPSYSLSLLIPCLSSWLTMLLISFCAEPSFFYILPRYYQKLQCKSRNKKRCKSTS